MKRIITKTLLILLAVIGYAADASAQSAIYVGGHIRRNRPSTITTLRNSGFTNVILFNVSVEADGTLKTDGETICQNGAYVFGTLQTSEANYVTDIQNLKLPPTGVNRIEICVGGWGNSSFNNIKSLITTYGTGKTTMLYRNFKALIDTLKVVDAVNNDDEQCYDLTTAVKFHTMMYDLGLHTTLSPYTNMSFWKNLVTQLNAARPGACDLITLQCYSGGAGNNPSNWQMTGVTMWAGCMNEGDETKTPEESKMISWRDNNGVKGSALWLYNQEGWNLNAWAATMNRVYGAKTTTQGVATFYSDINYGGYAVQLPVGEFPMPEMALYGIKAADVSSLKINDGYKVTLYKRNVCKGTAASIVTTLTASTTNVGTAWNDATNAIKIEPIINGIDDVKATDNTTTIAFNAATDEITVSPASGQRVNVYDLAGRRLLSSKESCISLSSLPKGTYIVHAGNHSQKIVKP
jgi:hypothetical protein